jgi:hypothetical protein
MHGMLAPERFAAWMSGHTHVDRRYGFEYRYHSRSDAHSVALCTEILADILAATPALRVQGEELRITYGINERFTWPSTNKPKALDLAIGPPVGSKPAVAVDLGAADGAQAELMGGISKARLADVYFSCEAKTVMTEHGKSQPRIFDELSSSHEIVHRGRRDAIATGVTVVNIAKTFVSPLRQAAGQPLHVTHHNQPHAAAAMVNHLRGLNIRDSVAQVGFDAYATIVIDCDNQGPARLWTEDPAPQPGDLDHYETFLNRVSTFYTERFGDGG